MCGQWDAATGPLCPALFPSRKAIYSLEVVEYFREILSENLTNTPRKDRPSLGKKKLQKAKGP
jgi:hypothetical protein